MIRLSMIRFFDLIFCLVVLSSIGCSPEPPAADAKETAANSNTKADKKKSPTNSLTAGPTYQGMCDASAAVAINQSQFIVANDEDNTLRVFSRDKGGMPLATFDMTPFLKPNSKRPETDIEGAAWLGDYVFWITSHGRNRNAKIRPSRYRFFATKIELIDKKITVKPIGKWYERLARDLIDDPRFKKFHLAEASSKAPKSKDGLNIEGLCATADKKLLIAFRNPIRKGKALLVTLANPLDVVQKSAKPVLEDPQTIDLDGLGVRSMEYDAVRKKYLIIAGSYNSGGKSKMYQWSGESNEKPQRIKTVKFGKFNPEAMFIYPDKGDRHVQILSDDGTRLIGDESCKSLADKKKRVFRSSWLILK